MATISSRASRPPSIYTLSSSVSTSCFPCLHVRMLHEQCGHISTLTIHETPCQRPYFGWVLTHPAVSASPTAPPGLSCEGMQTHIAIERDKCKECKVVVEPKGRGMFGWRKEIQKDKADQREGDRSLPINEIVMRRMDWKGVVEARKAMREERTLGRGRI